MKTHNVLIIGATGKVGSAVYQQLRHHDHVNAVPAVRDTQKANTVFPDAEQIRHCDLDDVVSIKHAVHDIDALLLLTGYSVDMLKQSKRVIDEAKRVGVKHIVHVGASGNTTAEVAHWGWHRMVEAYIEQQGFSYTHLQPEAFMQNITAFGWLNGGTLTNLIKDSTWSWVDANDVGALAAEALARPEDFENQTWQMGYDTATMEDVAKGLSYQLNKPIETLAMDPNTFYEGAISAGADPAYMSCVRDQFILNGQNAIAGADATFSSEAFEQAVGRKPTTWENFLNKEFAQD